MFFKRKENTANKTQNNQDVKQSRHKQNNIKDQLRAKRTRIVTFFNGLQDENKIPKTLRIIVLVSIVLVVGVVAYILLGLSTKTYGDQLLSRKEYIKEETITPPLKLTAATTWKDFREQIKADGLANKHFPATIAFLNAYCSVGMTQHERNIYLATYQYLSQLPHISQKPEFQAMNICQKDHFTNLLNKAIKEVGQFDSDKSHQEYANMLQQEENLKLRLESILEERREMKQRYGDNYNEASGVLLVKEKHVDLLEKEKSQQQEWENIHRDLARISIEKENIKRKAVGH